MMTVTMLVVMMMIMMISKQLGLTSLFANMFSIQVEPCHNEHDHDDDDNVGGDDDDHDD